jgi:hypothetical protein
MIKGRFTKFFGVTTLVLLMTNCSVEESQQEKEEADAQEADIEAEYAQDEETLSAAAKTKSPETGESVACTTFKQEIANRGIWIHPSGYRVRYVNTRLSFTNAKQACASSSTVATLGLATSAQLSYMKDIFTLPTGEKCNTDIWTPKSSTAGTRILMPAGTTLSDGAKDGKAVCVVQE